jgi:hypothetical protein
VRNNYNNIDSSKTNLMDVHVDSLHQSRLPTARHSEHDARNRVLPRRPQLVSVKTRPGSECWGKGKEKQPVPACCVCADLSTSTSNRFIFSCSWAKKTDFFVAAEPMVMHAGHVPGFGVWQIDGRLCLCRGFLF